MTHKQINILHLRDSPWVDGPGRTILETGSLIDNMKYNYIIGAFAGPDGKNSPLLESAASRGIKVFPITERKSFDPYIIKQILNFIDLNKIHILHCHETRSDLFGLICAKRRNIRLATTVHGWIANNFKSKILTQIDITALHFFDMIISVSEATKKLLLQYRIPENKIHVLRNSILVNQFIPDKLDLNFKKELKISPATILVGNIGRLSPEKGQEDLIRAARIVLKKGYNIKFVFIGTGPDKEKIQKIAQDLSISNSILFTGYREDIKRIYNSLDLVIQSSYTEGMPNVILESLLMETPIIATDVGGTSEIIKDWATILLVQPGDINGMSLKIEDFIRNPSYYQKITIDGSKYVKNKFNFHWRTKKLGQLYDTLMKQ